MDQFLLPMQMNNLLHDVSEKELVWSGGLLRDVEPGETVVGVASNEHRRLFALLGRAQLRKLEAERLLTERRARPLQSDVQKQLEYEAVDADRYFHHFFSALAIRLREDFPMVPKEADVDVELRYEWRVIWRRHDDVEILEGTGH